jgi:hypothetical protein
MAGKHVMDGVRLHAGLSALSRWRLRAGEWKKKK